jgi:hypothetical protein
MASDPFDIEKAVEAITSLPFAEPQTKATKDLLQYLSENVAAPVPTLSGDQCAIAVDCGLDCLLEFLPKLVPPNWQSKTTTRLCNRLSDVVKLLRESSPAVLVITSNLFLDTGAEGISALVAVSPGTRYLVMNGVESFIADFQQVSECVLVRIHTIMMPFSGDEFRAALARLIAA